MKIIIHDLWCLLTWNRHGWLTSNVNYPASNEAPYFHYRMYGLYPSVNDGICSWWNMYHETLFHVELHHFVGQRIQKLLFFSEITCRCQYYVYILMLACYCRKALGHSVQYFNFIRLKCLKSERGKLVAESMSSYPSWLMMSLTR